MTSYSGSLCRCYFWLLLDCWLHCAVWLCPNQFEAHKEYLYGGCALFSGFNYELFCCSSLFLVSCFSMSSVEHGEPFSFVKKDLWHVPVMFPTLLIQYMFCFVALYNVKSRETHRVRRVSDLQLRNGVKGHTKAFAFHTQTATAFGSACVRIRRVLNSQLPCLEGTVSEIHGPVSFVSNLKMVD